MICMSTSLPAGGLTDRGENDITDLEARIKQSGRDLYAALTDLTDRLPAKSHTPRDVARTLSIHRTLASRLLSAMRTDDPLAAISRMPRSEGLRRILESSKSVVPDAVITRAENALREFELVVHRELGGWDGFDAAITEWLPDARARFELANKQLAFKGTANLMGVRSDVELNSAIYYPDASGKRCDIVILEGLVGLRRLRPSVQIPVVVHNHRPGTPQPLQFVLENISPEQTVDEYPLLTQFCSQPCPKLTAVPAGDMTNYILAGNQIGVDSEVDIFTASVVRSGRPMYRSPDEPPVRPQWSAGINLPAKTLSMNLMLHEDVFPGNDPQLFMYDIHIRGIASPEDSSRDLDRLDLVESVQPLGKGVARFRASDVGRHAEMVQYICDRLGWDGSRLRGYRVHVQYPVLNAQYCLALDPLPVDPDASST
jgi:hypothetical protein